MQNTTTIDEIIAQDPGRSIRDLTNALLDDLLNPSLTSLELCQIHKLTLAQLAAILDSETFTQACAAIERIAAARTKLVESESRSIALTRLADLLKYFPTTPAQAETTRKAATTLLSTNHQTPRPPSSPSSHPPYSLHKVNNKHRYKKPVTKIPSVDPGTKSANMDIPVEMRDICCREICNPDKPMEKRDMFNKIAIVIATTASLANMAQANIIANGSFELPNQAPHWSTPRGAGSSLPGWTIAGGGVDHAHTAWQAADGNRSVSLNWVGASTLSQIITTDAGATYNLSFAMAAEIYGGPTIRSINVLWNGQLAGSYTFNYTGQSPTTMGWEYHNTQVVGTGSDLLEFVSTTAGNYGPALDDVSLVVIPAPGAAALLALSGLLAARRRR